MKTKFLVLVLLNASLLSVAQTTYFKKSIRGTHIHDYSLNTISARDGGLYNIGFDRDSENFANPYIMKMDGECNPQWRKRLTGNAGMISQLSLLIQLQGGDLLGVEVVPNSAQVHPKSLIRFDENGTIKWARSYDTYTRSIITSLTADSVTGHIKLGVADDVDDVQGIVELDSMGIILNQQLISLGAFSMGGCLPAPGGGFYFSGADGYNGTDWDAYCGRVDGNGNIRWSHKETPGNFFTRSYALPIILPEGDILWNFSQSDLVTYGNSKNCIARIDSNGSFIWIKSIEAAVGDTISQAIVTKSDNGPLVLIAILKSPDRTVICPIDENGDIQPGKLFHVKLWPWYIFSKINFTSGNLLFYGNESASGQGVFIKTNMADTNCLESNYTLTTTPATFINSGVVLGTDIFYFNEDTTLSFSMVNQSYSDSVWCANTGISELKQSENWLLYPNPATSQLTINLEGMQAGEVNIYNIDGKLVGEANQPANNTIDVSYLAKGMYFVEIKVDDVLLRRRWVKM